MIKRVQIEPWTTWEKLCLANAVLKAGDQNWNAVSRSVKIIYEDSMTILGHEVRPPHWFSVKQCAAQYDLLMARIVPRRKKRERNPESSDPIHRDAIYSALKNDYIEELEKKKEEDRTEYSRLYKRREDILSGVYDDVLEEMWAEECKEKDRDIKLKLKYKLGEKNAERNASPMKTYTTTNNDTSPSVVTPPPTSSTSPLLTSLLQSPSQHSLPSSPSISLLLNSTPSMPTNESPTLTKLLESPSSKVPVSASGNVLETSLRSRPSDLPTPTLLSPPRTTQLPQTSPIKLEIKKEVKEEPVLKESTPPQNKQQIQQLHDNSPRKILSNIVQSEIIIEEEEVPKKKIKLEDETEEDEEVSESVEEILEKLKEVITEAVGGSGDSEQEGEKDVSRTEAATVDQEESSKSPQVKTSDDEKEVSEDLEEVTTGDDTSKDVPEDQTTSENAPSRSESPEKVNQTEENNSTDDEDSVQVDHNDQEAVEIIMGSNSNSVVNVLAQDSSSEDVTQGSAVEENKESSSEIIDEESKTDKEDVEEPQDDKSEAETPMDVDEDSSSKSPAKDDEEEDGVEEEEECVATEETSSSEAVEVEPEKKEDKQPDPPPAFTTETRAKSVTPSPSKQILPVVDQPEVLKEDPIAPMSPKDEIKTPAPDKGRRSRKRSSTVVDLKPSSPATSFNEDEKEHRAWKKSVLLVFSRIASHKYASVFSKPITDAAGYRNLILCPMDLSTIKRNIETGIIRSTMEFQRDVLLMIQNAVIYNAENSLVYNMAQEMWTDVTNEMHVMVQALGDGVPLGRPGENDTTTPTRSGRQAKLSSDKKPTAPSKRSTRRP